MMMPPPGKGSAPLPPTDAKALRTRPVFPYPLVAKYTGHGSADDAANYVAAIGPVADPVSYAWQGTEFYKADSLKVYVVKDAKLVAVSAK
jgi:feruloyl esterase